MHQVGQCYAAGAAVAPMLAEEQGAVARCCYLHRPSYELAAAVVPASPDIDAGDDDDEGGRQ